jgi:hypothetical protein
MEAFSEYIRINPDIRTQECYTLTLSQAYDPLIDGTSLTITSKYNSDDLFYMERDLVYEIQSPSGELSEYFKLSDVDVDLSTVEISAELTNSFPVGSRIALIDRPIGQSGSMAADAQLKWASPPTLFSINSTPGYLRFTVYNNSKEETGLIFGMINGWITDLVGGD